MPVSLAIFLSRNSSLIKSQNLLENPLLFPTQITNLLFVIKNRQPLKQNFMLNCKKTIIKKKNCDKLDFVTLRCGILTLNTSDSFFRSFRFLRQNEAFSATEQNQTYKNSLSFRNLNAIQLRTTFFSGVCRIPPLSHRLNN